MTEILFTGTGSGSVSLKRYHSSFLIMKDGQNSLIDAGDSIPRALLQAGIHFNSVNNIIITHFHPDHINGISSLLIQMKLNKRKEGLKIYVHSRLEKDLSDFLRINYIFAERMNYTLDIIPFESRIETESGQISFRAFENTHLDKYKDHAEEQVSCSFMFNIDGRRLWYSGDIGSSDDLMLFENEVPDIYITESTHAGIEGLNKLISTREIKTIIVTHIADEMEEELNRWRESLNLIDKQRCILAEDGMIYKM